ncbi:hypothetical protein AYI69_g1111 [Smittium culicis]|uniref:Uncharacterized protein n=1 Tax=Smittium culicis TaxID=133412 RepID=A0A1R1YRI0_9FUNG|nr:hypothetical protein AYI69_g1111 [Smittium culicis]
MDRGFYPSMISHFCYVHSMPSNHNLNEFDQQPVSSSVSSNSSFSSLENSSLIDFSTSSQNQFNNLKRKSFDSGIQNQNSIALNLDSNIPYKKSKNIFF